MSSFHTQVHACGRLNRLCVTVYAFLFWGDFGQELFSKAWHAFVISGTKDKIWIGLIVRLGLVQFVQSTGNGL